MHRLTTRTLRMLPALALVMTIACGGSEDSKTTDGPPPPPPFPVGAGIKRAELQLSTLQAGGWVVCFNDTYNDFGAPIAQLLGTCAGPYVMLACAPSTSGTLTLAAADFRTVVFDPDAGTSTAHKVSNGVGWYFNDTVSMGFFPEGAALDRNPCDSSTTLNDQRLCWRAIDDAGDAVLNTGYRCGDPGTTGSSWRRLVLVHP